MTLVDAETGEVLDQLSEQEARDLTDAIRSGLEIVWDDVVEAYQRQAHTALGYDSWNHYCTQEFGASSLKLPKEDRRDTVASLRDAGLSTRAIAAATGTSDATVRRDLAGASNDAPDDVEPNFKPSQIKGTDGKSYAKTTTRKSESTTTETAPTAGKEGPGLDTPAPSEPDAPTSEDVERHADPRLTFRANFSKEIAKAGGLRMVDIDKAVSCADADDLAGFRQSVESIRDWCDRFLEASGTSHLRRVK